MRMPFKQKLDELDEIVKRNEAQCMINHMPLGYIITTDKTIESMEFPGGKVTLSYDALRSKMNKKSLKNE